MISRRGFMGSGAALLIEYELLGDGREHTR